MNFNMVEKQVGNNESLLLIKGELDVFTIEHVIKRINELSTPVCILDLEEVTFMDSSGIGLIIREVMDWKEEGRNLNFINIQPPILEVLEEMDIFTILGEVQS